MPESIIIFRTDGIGDVILTLPMASALKQARPDARVTFCVRSYTAPIVRLCPDVDDVVEISGRDLDSGICRFAASLKNAMYGAAVFAYPRPRLALASRIAGIPRRIGSAYRPYSLLFSDRVHDHRHDSRFHESEYNIRLLGPLGCSPEASIGQLLELPHGLKQIARERLSSMGIGCGGKLIVLHPGSRGSAKEWGIENFARLGAAIAEAFPDADILVTGTSPELQSMEYVAGLSGPEAHVYCGDDGLDLFAAVLSHASVCVANSTGPLHLASALGVPVVGLYPFQTECNPRRWRPLGRDVSVLMPDAREGCGDCLKGKCPVHDDLSTITVESVMKAVSETLGTFRAV
jgi:ADP-heptose:LPS heptosyltransferase